MVKWDYKQPNPGPFRVVVRLEDQDGTTYTIKQTGYDLKPGDDIKLELKAPEVLPSVQTS